MLTNTYSDRLTTRRPRIVSVQLSELQPETNEWCWGKNMKTFVLGVMGCSPTCSSRWAAQRPLLPSPVKVLGHWTGTLRTTGRRENPQPKGAEPILLGRILRSLDELNVGRARRPLPPPSATPALGRPPRHDDTVRTVPITLPDLGTTPPSSGCPSPYPWWGPLYGIL